MTNLVLSRAIASITRSTSLLPRLLSSAITLANAFERSGSGSREVVLQSCSCNTLLASSATKVRFIVTEL
ncbi:MULTISPECIES: hypothetical protein [unclassified Microcoleus]|uniref:hypothetical protein n=1 Tax=unclassified Microcoleus TaxID=2642155 RepID=UPI002FD3DC2E